MLMTKMGVKDIHDSIIAEIKSGSTMLCDLPIKTKMEAKQHIAI